ncbi:MAG: hypothetical protein M3P26_01135 [Gemmatimonadota bacterium]|nr:hypothetical protein [Gemmatimonadota bacterium]
MGHPEVLAIAYGTVCLLWLAASRPLPYWRSPKRPSFDHPWREVGFALLAALLVIGLGQLWLRGVRLPNHTAWRPVFESINQIAIFSPMLLLLLWRRQTLASAWLPGRHVAPRLAIGLGLAVIALAIYTALERGAPSFLSTLQRVFDPGNSHVAVQVLLEDITIAILMVRLGAALTNKWAVIVAAALFAGGHIPTMVSEGASSVQMIGLF